MRFKEAFLILCTALLIASTLSLMVTEAMCVVDKREVIHHGTGWWNYAYVEGERDGIYPNKYFREWHSAYDESSWTIVVEHTEISFEGDQYYYSWEADGELTKDGEYSYWSGKDITTIEAVFYDEYQHERWSDMTRAPIRATGGPE